MFATRFLILIPRLAALIVAVLMCATNAIAQSAAPVVVLQAQDAIGPASADFLIRGMAKAAEAKAKLVVIALDTPGGLDTSMRQIIQVILASPVPVAVYVSPQGARAASAGTYILYAAHIAAMAPATTLGAATPVAIGLPDLRPNSKPRSDADTEPDETKAPDEQPLAPVDPMTAKRVHDASAFIRGLAQRRSRNAQWAERAVREAVSLTAREALQENVIDVVANNIPDLLTQIDGRQVRVGETEVTLATSGLSFEVVQPDARQRLLSVIANPSFALILMMIGIYGLILEFSAPGFGLAGVVGAICLLLALFALQLLPVNYAGLALIVVGMALLGAELVVPGIGVVGAGGVIAFIAGGLLLFDRDIPGFGIPLFLILSLAAISAAFVSIVGGMALRARQRPVVSGSEQMLGAHGRVLSIDSDGAWARVHGERWQVHSDQALTPGQAIHVVGLQGLVLDVRGENESNQGDRS